MKYNTKIGLIGLEVQHSQEYEHWNLMQCHVRRCAWRPVQRSRVAFTKPSCSTSSTSKAWPTKLENGVGLSLSVLCVEHGLRLGDEKKLHVRPFEEVWNTRKARGGWKERICRATSVRPFGGKKQTDIDRSAAARDQERRTRKDGPAV